MKGLEKFWPVLPFRSPHHDRRNAAILGMALGVSFFTCFVTGLYSHFLQHPQGWMTWPARPAGLYRVTQGLHVATGLIALPLLLAKLWVVFPKLFEWPPAKNLAHALERLSLPPLIGGALFMLLTGVANINEWYFFPFFFTDTHYAMAWATIGALVVHIGAKWHIARASVFSAKSEASGVADLDRRGFLLGVAGAAGLITLFSVGQSFSPLGRLALLSPRRPGVGPQKLPVNKTANSAGVLASARADDYRLVVEGARLPVSFSRDELLAMSQHQAELPIACVEGWSASAMWEGVRVRDLLDLAEADPSRTVRVESLEANGLYRSSDLNQRQHQHEDTLLALKLNGEPLDIDHGYPCRLIAPNRPGVMQTKWVQKLVVT